jgi:hypothetical protein
MIYAQPIVAEVASTLGTEVTRGYGTLRYDSEDPFAIHLVFDGVPIWSFAKTLLFDAITHTGTQGVGDVQILDDDDETGMFIFFLASPEGVAAVKIPTDDVIEFAEQAREIDLAGGEEMAVSDALEDFLTGLLIVGE